MKKSKKQNNELIEPVLNNIPEVIDNAVEKSQPFFIKTMPVKQINCDNSSAIDEISEDALDEKKSRKKELNKKWLELTKRQFKLMLENTKLNFKILKIDMEYSSEFDDFVASIVGKKSVPLSAKVKKNEYEYSENEKKIKILEAEIEKL